VLKKKTQRVELNQLLS